MNLSLPNTFSVEQIMNYDMSRVLKNHSYKFKTNVEQLKEYEIELKRFFVLSILYPNDNLPMLSHAVDDLWHTFILTTHDYVRFCDKMAKRYIHHNPCTDGAIASITDKEHFIKKYEKAFGCQPSHDVWNVLVWSEHSPCSHGCTDGPIPRD